MAFADSTLEWAGEVAHQYDIPVETVLTCLVTIRPSAQTRNTTYCKFYTERFFEKYFEGVNYGS